jgi:hypothetical protein
MVIDYLHCCDIHVPDDVTISWVDTGVVLAVQNEPRMVGVVTIQGGARHGAG